MKLLSKNQSQILELLKEHSSLSVDELTHFLKTTKTAVRRQLLSMEKRGLLHRRHRAVQRGRPALEFQLTSAAHRLFPSKEAEVLNELIRFIQREKQGGLLERFFEAYWDQRLERIFTRIRKAKRDDLETRLDALKDVLEEEGFVPSVRLEKQKAEVMLRECHCPLEAVIDATRLPCRLEQRLIAKVLNAPIDSVQLRSEEHEHCEFRLPF